jgi:ATP-dependent RNA helicase SUPV3L1/SUV3
MQADNTLSATYYQMAGYRACGERALRLDMLERLADMIRPLDQKAGFEASPEMLSITGATLEQFVGIMGAFGFRAEKGDRPKTAKPQAKSRKAVKTETETEADAVKATGDGMKQNPAIIFQAEARPDVEAKAGVAAAAVETVAIPPLRDDATQKDSMVVDGKPDALPKTTVIVAASDESAVDSAAASATDEAASASATATDSTIASEIVAAEPEREIFYIFSRVPKPRRRDQGGVQEKRGEPRGNFQKHAGKNERGSGQRRADGGKQGTKGGKCRDGDVRAKTAFVSSPRREAKLDPDSPFAVLQRLKDQG